MASGTQLRRHSPPKGEGLHRRPGRRVGCPRPRSWGAFRVGLDVRSRQSFSDFLNGIDGPLQVLVNNAGIMPAGRFVDESDAVTDAIVGVNLGGRPQRFRSWRPRMLEQGSGHIVNVASYLGMAPQQAWLPIAPRSMPWSASANPLRDEVAGRRDGDRGSAVSGADRSGLGRRLAACCPRWIPEDIAEVAVESCKSRPAIIAVPELDAQAMRPAAALMPDRPWARSGASSPAIVSLRTLDTEARRGTTSASAGMPVKVPLREADKA